MFCLNKILFLLVFNSLGFLSIGQNSLHGIVINEESNAPIAFVNIGFIGKTTGTVSSINGDFTLNLDSISDNDTLRFSIIGYEPQILLLKDVSNKSNLRIGLKEKVYALNEIIINEEGLKENILGCKSESKRMIASPKSHLLGTEFGIKVKLKKNPTYIENFNFYIVKNDLEKLTFRLNIYSIKNELPHENLLNENIIFTLGNNQNGKFSIDLEKYNIVVKDDFIVTLECIDQSGSIDIKKGFLMSAAIGGSIYHRSTSQANWDKLSGVQIGFNLNTLY